MRLFGIKITPLLVFFIVLTIVALGYANFVAFPLSTRIAELNAEHDNNTARIDLLDETLANRAKILDEIAAYQAQSEYQHSIVATPTIDAVGAFEDILCAGDDAQVVLSNFSLAAPEPVAGAVPRRDGTALYRLPLSFVLQGTGSNAEDDIRSFLHNLEAREDAAYYVEGVQVAAQPAPVGTPVRPSMNPEGPIVTLRVSLYYYGVPLFGSVDSTATAGATQ